MNFRIEEENIDVLSEYGQVPIALEVKSRFRVELFDNGLGGIRLVEELVDPPYIKDYDSFGGPERWTRRTWDLSRWIVLAAYLEQERIGGAIVAFHDEGLNYCEGREDLAGLWDIRVRPEYRGRGVGRALFQRAETCAKQQGCSQFKIETQNINIPACRFYARMGAKLGQVHFYAYRTEGLDEVQLTWYKDL
ncbi:MAG: GNAT family N-acetyltransferase [Gemmatimonadota bacterium]|nr:GNAT family N-acetyltransferase [Gemmatimonadota bacterium]